MLKAIFCIGALDMQVGADNWSADIKKSVHPKACLAFAARYEFGA